MVRILVLWQQDVLVWLWGGSSEAPKVSRYARFRENTPY